MKFVFSFLILFTQQAFGRDMVVIHHNEKSAEQLEILVNTLTQQMGFPESFIQKRTGECQESDHALAVLCISDQGEVEIKQQNSAVMKRITAAFGGLRERQ